MYFQSVSMYILVPETFEKNVLRKTNTECFHNLNFIKLIWQGQEFALSIFCKWLLLVFKINVSIHKFFQKVGLELTK